MRCRLISLHLSLSQVPTRAAQCECPVSDSQLSGGNGGRFHQRQQCWYRAWKSRSLHPQQPSVPQKRGALSSLWLHCQHLHECIRSDSCRCILILFTSVALSSDYFKIIQLTKFKTLSLPLSAGVLVCVFCVVAVQGGFQVWVIAVLAALAVVCFIITMVIGRQPESKTKLSFKVNTHLQVHTEHFILSSYSGL